jgi:flavin-dependent dehydrogenase
MKTCGSVAVIGAGPAGSMAALQLSRAGFSVLLVHREKRLCARVAEVLSPQGRSILTTVGIWDQMPSGVATTCPGVVNAWERAEPSPRSFLTNPYGSGWHVDRERFDSWLTGIARSGGVSLVTGIAETVGWTDNVWNIDVRRSDRSILSARADFLVIATGRAQVGTFTRREHIDTLCLIGGIGDAATEGDELLIEAVPDGWWYSAPCADGKLFAGWITDPHLADKPYRDAMHTSLAQAPLTRARLAGRPQAHCIGAPSSAMTTCAGEAWIAIGDAALARDPLAGEGLAFALRSACEGAETVVRAHDGDSSAWQTASHRGADVVARYKKDRTIAYNAARRRWPNAPFWSERVRERDARLNIALNTYREWAHR